MADIEERLKAHSSAFEGLLTLIPANKYFEGDTSSQWNKRKQTKEESKRAKKAKLDPDAATTAAEVRKLKIEQQKQRQEEADDDDGIWKYDEDQIEKDRPQKTPKKPKTQKQKQKPAPSPTRTEISKSDDTATKKAKTKGKGKGNAVAPELEKHQHDEESSSDGEAKSDTSEIKISGFEVAGPTTAENTSVESTAPAPAITKPTLTPEERAERKARLTARIEALRAQRKADNPDGSPARNRQELLEARRRKEALRKERKKLARMQQKVEQQQPGKDGMSEGEDEAEGKIRAPSTKVQKDLSFGRVTFNDGRSLDPALQSFEKEKKRKGPTDILGQLKHTEAKKRRIANMPEEKKAVVEDKEKWAKALKQASGEKVRDDEKLLKKALKRQEKTKKKSEREWKERIDGVNKSKAMRQKKREENIQARKDQKAAGGKKGRKIGKTGKKAFKKSARPGFEGGIRSGRGQSKK